MIAVSFLGADPEKLKDVSCFSEKQKINADDEVKSQLEMMGFKSSKHRRIHHKKTEKLKNMLLGIK